MLLYPRSRFALALRSPVGITARPAPVPVIAFAVRHVSSALDVNTSGAQAEPTPKGVKLTAHQQYHAARLTPASLPADPLVLFRTWLEEALTAVREPEAMTLCTSTPSGVPSARAVLLKEVDERGFLFFTNYASRKARELAANPHAALAMHWRELARQVRVVGAVEKVSREDSEAYFATRPRGSQLGAWASAQSSVVGEGELEKAVQEVEKRFADADVPCPPGWGGYRVVPTEIEFWAGQPSRLHDRFVYLREAEGRPWRVERRAP
ncbi:pyridoxamine 5'-phosphate oxidase [Cutaneotrichosporon oleaginosum]|uniref:pyridoxal 5'-phosphate synthase n=1 Tax=Cutaneotrichosporon oleaginosum TaxID=879819 RepID=A0A0J0XF08_9TREE|nr:pyridoxamine 5'-phosphate oxidase [Cutaneotrichosporon oleaginosum]KLT39662.1 pyridoxamine 5'-phosphate oxidase [Cutaneotrichosporon oleaginosum]TXT07031.1 hypothetical protein COLE_06362 [Cutaneotrichosporon oleaginosum]